MNRYDQSGWNSPQQKETRSCYDIFREINDRQVTALMVHDQMADIFWFMQLKGFACMHEYQFLCESMGHRKTKKHYLCEHGKLLPDGEFKNPEILPVDWLKYTKSDVTNQVRLQYIEKTLTTYKTWEHETKEMYEKAICDLMANGSVCDAKFVYFLLEDVSEELKELEDLCAKLRMHDDMLSGALGVQHWLHKKYRKKLEEL